MRKITFIIIFSGLYSCIYAQKNKSYEISSPDNKIKIIITTGSKLHWSLQQNNQPVILPSSVSLQLENENIGDNASIISSPKEKVSRSYDAVNYHKKTVKDEYNQLTLNLKGNSGIIFRAYNDAAAYRFFTKKNGGIIINSEEANFNFPEDQKAWYPVQWDYREEKISIRHSKHCIMKQTCLPFQKIPLPFFRYYLLPVIIKKWPYWRQTSKITRVCTLT